MITIRSYSADRQDDFLTLNRALMDHYRLAPATQEEETTLTRLMSAGRYLTCEIAYLDDRPVGFTTWLLVYPTGASLSMFMKELFVVPDAQGSGIGRRLMMNLVGIAGREGCKRIDWQTDHDNVAARAFYERLGVNEINKISYRLTADQFGQFGIFER